MYARTSAVLMGSAPAHDWWVRAGGVRKQDRSTGKEEGNAKGEVGRFSLGPLRLRSWSWEWWRLARDADVTTEKGASILVFPKVQANSTFDTVIQIANTGNSMLHAHCFYVDASLT